MKAFEEPLPNISWYRLLCGSQLGQREGRLKEEIGHQNKVTVFEDLGAFMTLCCVLHLSVFIYMRSVVTLGVYNLTYDHKASWMLHPEKETH